MKAVQVDDYGDVEVLDVREVERPEAGPDQVLVAVRAAGINPTRPRRESATGPAYGALFGCQMISHRWPSGSRK